MVQKKVSRRFIHLKVKKKQKQIAIMSHSFYICTQRITGETKVLRTVTCDSKRPGKISFPNDFHKLHNYRIEKVMFRYKLIFGT